MGNASALLSRSTISTAYKTSPKCQSCGISLVYDPERGGTHSDGSKSVDYCSHCFRHGRFVDPKLTLEQMRWQSRERLVAHGYPAVVARFMTTGIGRLA